MTISVQKYFETNEKHVLIDVRTPSEFEQGHLVNAVNLPLFSDEERVIVGTIYKKQGSQKAMISGLEIVGPKMKNIVLKAKEILGDQKGYVYCWRGGKRSGSVQWLLSMSGMNVDQIEGGYKALRNNRHESMRSITHPLLILSGATGSGKSEILELLSEKGEQVLDLETLAHHKGSSFGALGKSAQPSSEQFNNDIYEVMSHFDWTKRIWVENESMRIGKVTIGEPLWEVMQKAKIIELDTPHEDRVSFLVDNYGQYPIDKLKNGFRRIERSLGGQNLQKAIKALDDNQLDIAVEIALAYYDKAYVYGRVKRSQKVNFNLTMEKMNFNLSADLLIELANNNSL